MNTLNSNPIPRTSISMKAIGLITLVAAAVGLFFAVRHFNAPRSEPTAAFLDLQRQMNDAVERSKPTWQRTADAARTAVPNPAKSGLSDLATSTTYKPGVMRPVKITTGDLYSWDMFKSNTRWWLLAKNSEDAKWMDQYGYPTVAEEEMLVSASDADLAALAANGDLNAKAHQAVRLAKRALMSPASSQDAVLAGSTMEVLLGQGGPYQALTVMRGFGEMLKMYRDLAPEQQTEDMRKALRTYDMARQVAAALGVAYGDRTFTYTSNTMGFVRSDVEQGLRIPDLKAEGAMAALANNARYRVSAGLPPLTILARPDDFPASHQIVQRY